MANFARTNSRMSWKVALLVALINALLTALVVVPVAEKLMDAHHVSNFEGKQGFAIAFVFIPAGFIGGFLLGLLGTKLAHAAEWAQFWKALGFAVALGQGVLFSIAGLSLLTIVRPPLIDGQSLVLQMEVLVPMSRITPEARMKDGMRISLYAGGKDNHYADVDTSAFRQEGGLFIVPATASLNSRSFQRSVSFHIGTETWLAYDLLLPATPAEKDFDWTEPKPMHEARTAVSDRTLTDVLLRYKVVKGEKAEE